MRLESRTQLTVYPEDFSNLEYGVFLDGTPVEWSKQVRFITSEKSDEKRKSCSLSTTATKKTVDCSSFTSMLEHCFMNNCHAREGFLAVEDITSYEEKNLTVHKAYLLNSQPSVL